MRKKTIGLILLVIGLLMLLRFGSALLLYLMVTGPGGATMEGWLAPAVLCIVFLSMTLLGLYLMIRGNAEEQKEWQRMASSRCPRCGAHVRPGQAYCSWCGADVSQPINDVVVQPGNR